MKIMPESVESEIAAFRKENLDPAKEVKHIHSLLASPEAEELLKDYSYERFIAAGGSGLVFAVKDNISGTGRALKLSRANAVAQEKKPHDPVNVELEIEALSLVSHQNVTR